MSFGELRVFGAREAAAEQRRIEARMADERDDIAAARVDRDDRAAPRAESVLGGLLHRQVERQDQILAGQRCLRVQLGLVGALTFHRSPLGVDQDLAVAVASVQLGFVGAFDAQLADQRGAGVAGPIDALQVLLADGAHVAERVHAELAVGVVARLASAQVHAREIRSGARRSAPISSSVRRRRIGTLSKLRRDRIVRRASSSSSAGIRSQRGQAVQRVAQIRHLLADQLELVGRLVVDQHGAMAVEDQAAARRESDRGARGCPATARRSSRGGRPAATPAAVPATRRARRPSPSPRTRARKKCAVRSSGP